MTCRTFSLKILLILVVAATLLSPHAVSAEEHFLAKGGQAEAIIVVGRESGPFYRWIAEEVQRYLGLVQKLLVQLLEGPRREGVVPITVECVGFQLEFRKLRITHFDGLLIMTGIQSRFDGQACLRGRVRDQADDRFVAHQGFASPVLGDEAEQAMFDLVPFAGARGKVTDDQLQFQFVRQLLQRHLPQATTVSIAASAIRRDQQFLGVRKTLFAHFAPPAADAVAGELGRVMVNPHADPTLVVEHIVHPVGNRLAQGFVEKVMDPYFLRFPLRMPLPSAVAEIPDQFLLLRVNRNRRLTVLERSADPLVDVLELGVTVGMRRPFPSLAIRLQTVPGFMQQLGYRATTYGMLLAGEFLSQMSHALARPTQRRLGIASGGRFNQRLQRREQPRIALRQAGPSRPRPAYARSLGFPLGLGQIQFPHARSNRHSGQPGCCGHGRHASPSQIHRLGRRPLSPPAFIPLRLQRLELLSNSRDDLRILHTEIIASPA